MAKYKKLTQKEKKQRAESRKELRDRGLLPPVKPRLNRKQFADEVLKDYNETFSKSDETLYLMEAIRWMKPTSIYEKITSEQVGILKLLKLTVDLKKFSDDLASKGETQYKLMDVYKDVVEPIMKL